MQRNSAGVGVEPWQQAKTTAAGGEEGCTSLPACDTGGEDVWHGTGKGAEGDEEGGEGGESVATEKLR